MNPEFIEFLQKNASAIFALLGVISGSLLTGVFSYISKARETKLRITEKVVDRKLQAHDNLIDFLGQIRTMLLLGGWDGEKELKRTPLPMNGQQELSDFLVNFSSMRNSSERWFSFGLKREISLFLDYVVSLNELVRTASDEKLQEIGALIRYDFIEFAVKIEDSAHDFINKDLLKLDHKTDRKWHKYKPEETIKKLGDTRLFKFRETIEIMLISDK
ncbi:hypothetical protein SAMN05216206_2690 [Pseudomonas guineae]|uniref:Uncharacterized protein n=1 Tax=Pseudomonas guineae TaxID=425504 RepID=A0A1I3K1V8_9PSED|nr:hypothetical protein [Pseudomonas guineae]SFI66416.1 hypothetical protein SAMN05216206_2690 [Pseudomonas guineae]